MELNQTPQIKAAPQPKEWVPKAISRFSGFVTKGATPTTYGFGWQNEGVLFLRSECVSDNGLDLGESMFISRKAHAVLSRGEVQSGDILMTITGNVGRVVLLRPDFGYANINQHIARVRITDAKVNPQFVYHYLSQPEVRSYYNSITTGQAYPQISLAQVRDTVVPLPTKREQDAIAAALSDVDALLLKLDQLIAKKRDLKQGAMQELVSGRTRLPGFAGTWRLRRMRDLGATYGGLTGKSKADFGTGAARYITFLNVLTNVVIDSSNFGYVSIPAFEKQNEARKGDLFFNGSSETPEEVGMCSVLVDELQNVYLNSFCFGFRLHNGVRASGLYLAYFFRSDTGRSHLYSLAQGAIRYNLSKSQFLDLHIRLPDVDEQLAISATLADMDREIAAHQGRRNKVRALKQGMMQELLTGRIRLV